MSSSFPLLRWSVFAYEELKEDDDDDDDLEFVDIFANAFRG